MVVENGREEKRMTARLPRTKETRTKAGLKVRKKNGATKLATLRPINASRTTRLLSLHGRADSDDFPRDSRTCEEYRNAIFLSAEFQLALSPARPDRPILFAHQDAKRLLVHAELDRAISDQFPIELDRDGLVAVHAQ